MILNRTKTTSSEKLNLLFAAQLECNGACNVLIKIILKFCARIVFIISIADNFRGLFSEIGF